MTDATRDYLKYLDFVNHFVTVERFAAYHGMTLAEAGKLVSKWKNAY